MRYLSSLIAIITLFTQCKKDDPQEPDILLSPPEWIIGTWAANPDDMLHSYTFTANNIIDDFGDGMSITDWSELNIYYEDLQMGVKIIETEKSESLYKVTISTITGSGTSNTIYSFQKTDDNYILVNQTPYTHFTKYYKK